MRFHRHFLRDVFWLSLPIPALLVYFTLTTVVDTYNAEIANFHGYPVHGLRAGGPKEMLRRSTEPLLYPRRPRYLNDRRADPTADLVDPPIPSINLWVHGTVQDRLASAIPASAKEWHPAWLFTDAGMQRIEVHYRGQMMTHFFWRSKSWKLKTRRRELVDGYRIINLTPIDRRLHSHLTFLVGRRVGLPTPMSRPVRLFVNKEGKGLYLQEEQIDESMVRRNGRMPGDIFYGESVVPREPKRGPNDLFWNPFLWTKKARDNRYTREHRPYLGELLDHVCDDSVESFGRLYELLDMEEFALYYAVLTFQGDQHINHSHNHKLYFNPLSGRFEAILWNPLLYMPEGEGVESTANRLFRKLARDPRFLDRVHRLIWTRMVQKDMTLAQMDELERLQSGYSRYALSGKAFANLIQYMGRVVRSRGATVRKWLGVARLDYEEARRGDSTALTLHATSATSLRLRGIELNGNAQDLRLFEDRDRDGRVGPPDRELELQTDGNQLRITSSDALVFTGRDFRATYVDAHGEGVETARAARDYTRLASLESRYLLVSRGGRPVPAVAGLRVERIVASGPVDVRKGKPEGYVATETVHPWDIPPPPEPRKILWGGEVRLEADLRVTERDELAVEPGTTVLLAPGVSILIESRVQIDGVTFRRLDPERPWGVVALQGRGSNGSTIRRCRFSGGSEDTLRHVYYSGMLSAHYVDDLVVEECDLEGNVLGDDTLRFGKCDRLSLRGIRVQGANGDAIDCDLCTGEITQATVVDSRNDGIDLMTSKVDLRRIDVLRAGDKGISLGEGAHPEVEDVQIHDCVTGIGIKDGSNPEIRASRIQGCQVGIDSFDKNWRYPGGGQGRLIDCALSENRKDVRLDERSRLTLEHCATDGRYELPESLPEDRFQEVSPKRSPAR